MNKFLTIVAIGIMAASCSNPAPQGGGGPKVLPYPVIEVGTRDIVGQSNYPVRLEGVVNSEVRAKISGYITQVLVDEGQTVSKGQALFRLETHTLSEDAQAAKANVEAAQVGVDQLRPLVEKNIVSPVQLQTAEAKLAQAKAAYNSISANIGYALISSPIDGVVGAITYRNGSLVSPTSSLPLTTISKTNEVFGYFSMNEAEYMDFLQHTPGTTLNEKISHFPEVQVRLANGSIYNHTGKIQTTTAQVNPSTGAVSFRANFPNPEQLIANGSSGTIVIPKKYNQVLAIPEESTYEQQGKIYVYVLNQDNSVTTRVIEVEDRVDNVLIIKTGLNAGEKIVAKGVGKLRDKDIIQPTPISMDSVLTQLKTAFR